jgi:hypothetical protein
MFESMDLDLADRRLKGPSEDWSLYKHWNSMVESQKFL